jgi:hypothetical protein
MNKESSAMQILRYTVILSQYLHARRATIARHSEPMINEHQTWDILAGNVESLSCDGLRPPLQR